MPSPPSQSRFLYLITKEWKTGKLHKIEIWFVKQNKKYYILSEHRKKAHRIQNILHDSIISFRVNNKTLNGHARILEDDKDKDLIMKISALMDRKYDWSDGLIVELYPKDSIYLINLTHFWKQVQIYTKLMLHTFRPSFLIS